MTAGELIRSGRGPACPRPSSPSASRRPVTDPRWEEKCCLRLRPLHGPGPLRAGRATGGAPGRLYVKERLTRPWRAAASPRRATSSTRTRSSPRSRSTGSSNPDRVARANPPGCRRGPNGLDLTLSRRAETPTAPAKRSRRWGRSQRRGRPSARPWRRPWRWPIRSWESRGARAATTTCGVRPSASTSARAFAPGWRRRATWWWIWRRWLREPGGAPGGDAPSRGT